MQKNKEVVHPIEIKSPDNDFIVTEGPTSKKILARGHTYDGAREKAILLKLDCPMITREKYLKAKK